MRTISWLFITGALLFAFGIGFVVIGARAAMKVFDAISVSSTAHTSGAPAKNQTFQ